MKSNIFIPKTINVGYQNRSDTYTGKLAYVVYYDEKGKLRKEASWNNWRDEKIPNEEFDNVPTAGFVLNKKVGDYSSGWDHRKAYCRIYDPRNFEFEITVENLLYILENANSIKGKGLEGEFIYGWDGKDLVLMPVESPDYKQISEYNKIVHSNESIKAKNLIVGAVYLTKNNEERIYMGKFDYYSYGYRWLENGEYKTSKNSNDIPTEANSGYRWYRHRIPHESIDYPYGKYFWFAYKNYEYDYVNGEKIYKDTYKWRFEQYKSIPANKFITCMNDKCTQDYPEIYEAMIRTSSFSPRDYDNVKYVSYSFEEFKKFAEKTEDKYGRGNFVRYNTSYFSDSHYEYKISCDDETGLWTVEQRNYPYRLKYKNDDDFYNRFSFENVKVKGYYSWERKSIEKKIVPMTIEELFEKLKPCYKEVYLENGYLYERECYYGSEE